MGTETALWYESQYLLKMRPVKLNNPLMGTETIEISIEGMMIEISKR